MSSTDIEDDTQPKTHGSSDGKHGGSRPGSGRKRGKRYRTVPGGNGDFLIAQVSTPSDDLPKNSLVLVPGVPQFPTCSAAERWMKKESKDLFLGKTVAIVRMCKFFDPQLESSPQVVFIEHPRELINDPLEESA